MTVKLTPTQFGKDHRKLFESVVAPRAEALNTRSLNNDLHLAMATGHLQDKKLKLMYPSVQAVHEGKRSLPLKDAYALDEQLAIEAAAQAAKATGGVLTSASARFLPTHYRRDFEHLAGIKADASPGIAVPGVEISEPSKGRVAVKVEFTKALAGVTARELVLAVTRDFILVASRVNNPERKDLPPYWLTISGRDGETRDMYILDKGQSSLGPDSGHLIRAGSTTLELVDQQRKRTYATVTFTVDAVNDISDTKPTTEKTASVRDTWGPRYDGKTLKTDGLKKVDRKQAENTTGMKSVLSAIRANTGASITRLVDKGRLQFFLEPKTNTLASYVSRDGETGGHLIIVDVAKKRWVGDFNHEMEFTER